MKRSRLFIFAGYLLAMSCVSDKAIHHPEPSNPLLREWSGPYGGVPAFQEMKVEHLRGAVEEAIAIALRNYETIANADAPPDFRNTIVEMEKAEDVLNRALVFHDLWENNLSSPEFRAVQEVISPMLADFRNKVNQNEKLFQRVKTVYEASRRTPLPAEEQRLVQIIHDDFVLGGAALNPTQKSRFAEIQRELSLLQNKFANNVLVDEEKAIFLQRDEMEGLPESFIKAAAAAAIEQGKEGQFAIQNTRASVTAFLANSPRRDLRERVWRAFYFRGESPDSTDNNDVIKKILLLRHERSRLLGFANFAEWRVVNRMAKNPGNALALLDSIWLPALEKAKAELRHASDLAAKDKLNLMPWDRHFYGERAKKRIFDFDNEELSQYLQLDKLTDAMFYVAQQVFNFDFKPVSDVPVHHPDVKVWEVTDHSSGDHIGLFYLDPYARPGKRSGAWADNFRKHSTFNGKQSTLCHNNSNFIKPAEGEPPLTSWENASTFFHEFGHALHMLSSNVRYPKLNKGVWDYVEFHSQLLERWLLTDSVINKFLIHHQTGKPIPNQLISRLRESTRFGQGIFTAEYLASALIDLRFHTADPVSLDPAAFEKMLRDSLRMPEALVLIHRPPHFKHVFSGEDYAAGYYSYIWADVLTADAAEFLSKAPGGFYDRNLTRKMVAHLFAPRNAVDPVVAYRNFRGRDPDLGALLRDRGLDKAKPD